MAGSDADQKRRRRAVYTALRKILRKEDLAWALCMWVRDYADKPTFALRDYTHTLNDVLKLGRRRGDLYRELVTQMFQPSGDLAPDPIEMIEANCGKGEHLELPPRPAESEQPDGPQSVLASDRVFALLMRQLIRRISAQAPKAAMAIHYEVVSNMPSAGFSDRASERIGPWLSDPRGPCPLPLERSLQQRLVHLMYVAVATELGPIAADRLLAAALAETEQSPDAIESPPRELL